MQTTITTKTKPTLGPTGQQLLLLLRKLHRKLGPEGMRELADLYERQQDPRYADIPRLLRAVGHLSDAAWDATIASVKGAR